jgi:hypothetical protein
MNFSKLAFRPVEQASYAGAIRVAENEECQEVYLIGENAQWLNALRAAGLTVHQVQSKEELPADVFHFYRHKGFWATVHTTSGILRNVGWAEDSLMAAKVLAGNYAPEFRAQFHVHPVDVKLLDMGW